MNSAALGKRDFYWDFVKWVLIALVVYGHALVLLSNMPESGSSHGIFNFIYLFHMPLFVFISGRFSHIREQKRYKKGIYKLIELYVTFQILHLIYCSFVGERITPYKALLIPQFSLWYLLCLVWWRCLILQIGECNLKKNPAIITLATVAICLLSGIIPIGNELGFQRTFVYLPYFFLGYYSHRIKFIEMLNRIPLWFSILLILTLFIVYAFYFNDDLSMLNMAYAYGPKYSIIDRVCYMFISCILCIGVMRVLMFSNKVFNELAGGGTLFIYLTHSFFLFLLQYAGFRNSNNLMILVITVVVVTLLTLLSRIKVLNSLLQPLSFVKSIVKNKK